MRSIHVRAGSLAAISAPVAMLGDPALAAGFLRPIGPIAEMQLLELIWASVIVLIAVLPVFVGVPVILWRYRRSNNQATYSPQWHFNTKLEILMWGVPTAIVVAFGIWLAQGVFRIDPYRTIDAEMARGMEFEIAGPTVRIDIVGLDWKWLYLYPDEGVASVGEMVIPVHRPVEIRLTSDTVMQSFMAPALAGQIYAMAGMETQLNLIASEEGETLAENTQYNGTGFPQQRGPVRAVAEDAYDAWIASARTAPPLDDRTYGLLAKSGDLAAARDDLDREGSGPFAFTLPDGALFGRVLARYMTGEPVPPETQPGSPTYDPEAARLPAAPHGAGRSVACTPTGPDADAVECPFPDDTHDNHMPGMDHE
ncbi:cytochrome o ubiquinol oxidase subunit 2 [Palleronia aestuarii]|uniref:Cytochrome o ubiquinol oxidase subunit 2 n=1 Tax=Palleronia aestuarii TaxID=568105 RepID=A0A2W7N6M3_9RHOB|nr:cytochrome ubiquinol oxidase subunit II [Palleronia aestuarii]PZX15720.1 cytochrome o ubiquinol oxidase subunit 2 [Palleronia aestuarii]